MSSGAKIAKNAMWLMMATTGQKLIAFVSFTVVARLLGAEMTGVFFYSISITSIFVTFADLGMTPVVIRAVAGNREDRHRLVGATLRSKAVLGPLAILGALFYAISFGADAITLTTVIIACLVMSADTIHLVFYAALRGTQNLRPEAIGMLVGQLLTAIASVTVAILGFGPVGLACALLIGSLWNVGWSGTQLQRAKFFSSKPARADYRVLAREAMPFGIAGIAVKVYSYVDSLFIQRFHGHAAVGVYAVAYKLTYAIQFLPITFTAALYPALAASYARKNEKELTETFLGSLRLMGAIGFPFSAALSALAPKIIPFFYGNAFIDAVPAFAVMPWVLLPIFLDFPIGALLNATHRAALKTTALVITMIVNVLLNAALVPAYGPLGAAWAGVGSFWGLFFIGSWFVRHEAGGLWQIAKLTGRALIGAAVIWYALMRIAGPMPLIVSAVFGGSVAVLMAFMLRFITVDDVFLAWRKFRPSVKAPEAPHE